jgi:hypothetical protein
MPKTHRYEALPKDDLHPTKPVPGVPIAIQTAHMHELREAQNQIADAHAVRDGLMHAWSLSNTLSRHDMAVATGLAKSRVDQLIREAAEKDIARRNAAAAKRLRRQPVPPGA